METQNEGFTDPENLGHWDGDTFYFDQPFTCTDEEGNPRVMRVLHTEFAVLADGITRQDVLYAIVNGAFRDN